MAKISFVSPPLSLRDRYGILAPLGSTMPSLALLSLASVARKAGFEVSIIPADSFDLDYEAVLKMISEFSPQYLAITATTFSIYQADELAKLAKERDNQLVTIMGGPHISAIPVETMEKFSSFDIGVVGEGEETFLELIGQVQEKKSLSGIKGIIYRENGKLVLNPNRELIKNLDLLPLPAWDLLEKFPNSYQPPIFRFKKLPAASIITSRGCPSQCIFCSRVVFGNTIRFFSAEYVFELMKTLNKKYGVREILIEDDTFFISKERIRAICDLIIKNKLKISWTCLGRVDNVEEDLLRLMKKAGCWQISFGIESGSDEVLRFAKKGANLELTKRALLVTKKAGILSKGFFILGFPNDSPETIEKTINLALKSPLNDISVSFMTPLPGSELYGKAKEFGSFDEDWHKMNLLEIVFVPKNLTKEELKKYSKILMRRFYLRPRIIWSYLIRAIKNPPILGRMIRGFFKFLGR